MSDSGHSPLNIDLQQRVSPDRWSEEAVLLMECAELTSEHSKFLEIEIDKSPLANSMYKILNELFNERENKIAELIEVTGNYAEVATNLERLDLVLEQEHITSLDVDMTNNSIPEYEELSPSISEEYNARLSQIKQVYDSEYQKLQSLCEEYEKGMLCVFREQPHCIPISQQKVDAIIESSRDRSKSIFFQLKTNVVEAVRHVKESMLESRTTKRKRKNFSKKATEILSRFFYSHLENPYPSEEIKADLAIQCNINIGQVSNWFGNKRIRYKRNIGKEMSDDIDMGQKFSPHCDSGDMLDDTNLDDISSSEDDID